MGILSRDEIERLLRNNKLDIVSTYDAYPFIKDKQLTNDGVDLRLADQAYIINSETLYIDSLDPAKKNYQRITIPIEGYLLPPQGFILASTMERINLPTDEYIGRIIGRSYYARMGLSIHCTQEKFSSENNSVVPLQLVNNSPVPIKIYPRQKIVSIQFEMLSGTSGGYHGTFQGEVHLMPPTMKESETQGYSKEELDEMLKPIEINKPYDAVLDEKIKNFINSEISTKLFELKKSTEELPKTRHTEGRQHIGLLSIKLISELVFAISVPMFFLLTTSVINLPENAKFLKDWLIWGSLITSILSGYGKVYSGQRD